MDACGKVNIHFAYSNLLLFFAVRSHDVLLDYMGTPQWELHGDNFT